MTKDTRPLFPMLLLSASLAACGDSQVPDLEESLRATAPEPLYATDDPYVVPVAELILQGRIANVQGRSDEAVTAFREALAIEPNNPEVHFALGTALVPLSQGRAGAARDFEVLDEGIEHIRTAAAAVPENANYAYWLGRALDIRGSDEEALAELERAVTLDPEHGTAQKRLGLVRLQRADAAGAREAFERALELLPDDAGVPFQLGNLLLEEDPQAARDYYRRATEISPTLSRAYLGLAQALSRLGDVEGAAEANRMLEVTKGYEARLAQLVAAATEAPRDFQAQYDAAEMYQLLGQSDRALTMFRRALELDPSSAPAHYWCGLIFASLGEWEVAVNHLEEAAYIDPTHLGVRIELVRASMVAGNEARAAELAEGLAEAVGGEDADVRATAGEVLLDTPFREEGLALLRGVLEEEPEREGVRLLLEE